ncbi:MAG: zf-HC2 domain-containing protein [Syntrophomonadaceae bacterium]
MNCQLVDKYLYDYCDNVLSPDQRVLFDQHLANCHSCRRAVDRALLETSILREEWDTPELSADFTSGVMERIAFTPIPQADPAATDVKRLRSRWFTGIAAAVAVLLMVLYAPGMIKNEKIMNVADREQIASEPAGDKAKVKRPAGKQYEDFLVGGTGEETGNTNRVYLSLPEQAQFDSSEVNGNSPAPVPKNESISYGANDSAVSNYATRESVDQQQSKEDTMGASEIITVQPVNLPASYTMVDKIADTGSCTYIFGTGIKKDSLTINIAQLPIHRSGQSSYSRSYVRPTSTADTQQKTGATPAKPAEGNNKAEQPAVAEPENAEILTKKEVKTDTTAAESSHTISYEVVHNNQTYLLTITANLSPDELVALSQNLQLQSTTP